MSSSEGEGAEHGAEHSRTTSPAPGARGRLAAENGPGASSLRGSPRPRVCRRLGHPVEAPLTCLHAACWSPHRRRSPCSRSRGRPGISWHFGVCFCVYIFGASWDIPSSRSCGLVRASPTHSWGSLPRASTGRAGAIGPERAPKPRCGHMFLLWVVIPLTVQLT